MKLLVLAQIPPPLHGQSQMVRTLVDGLPSRGIEVRHVNLRLSRTAADIGGWRPGKLLAVLDACFHALAVRWRGGADTLYYVPAPGKRGALYRDWLVLLICRPFFRRLILHFHNGGLADWLAHRATTPERWLTRRLLGRADLAIVLDALLRRDAEYLEPRRIAIVPNGIADPGAGIGAAAAPPVGPDFIVLFLGLCSEAKGLFTAAEGVLEANRRHGGRRFRLEAAGGFVDRDEQARFAALCTAHPQELSHLGFVTGDAKRTLFSRCHCVCLPSRYAHEAQPLVVLEALAHDRPVIVSDWRGLPAMVPADCGVVVPPGDPGSLAQALTLLANSPVPSGACRSHYLATGTQANHLSRLVAALSTLEQVPIV